MTVIQAFDGLAETLAQLDPAKVAQLKASDEVLERIEYLLSRKKTDVITQAEMIELERFMALDTLMSMAKARAKRLLSK